LRIGETATPKKKCGQSKKDTAQAASKVRNHQRTRAQMSLSHG
jgi:hypothetical protein